MRARGRATRVTSRPVLPERSRLTVGRTVAALRRTRSALVDIESELGNLLVRVRTPGARLGDLSIDRLAFARHEAAAAMASLNPYGEHFG